MPGSVKGLVKDTAHHYVLKTATISVYRLKDSTLLNYQLSNMYGEFNVKNLPVGTLLKLEVSYVGYHTLEKAFTISDPSNVFNAGELILKNKDITLKEVTVKVPPISMNGDTLEINPAAFKLDSNAVIEDVLRRTPGVTLWGDGTITVNGREVKSVYVDGKRFFADDPKIALQNIDKKAVQKVQIYKEKQDNEQNLLDSTLTMNVKLKANKKFGMFGKVSAGIGTQNHYEADGNLNVYDSKLQLGIVGASNDVNKLAGNASTLLANSTFKGVGANVSYQPDFRTSGINKPSAGGVVFKYDFKENPTYEKKSTLSANYFVQRKLYENKTANESTTTIANNNQIYGNSNGLNTNESTSQNFDNRFEYATRKGNFNFSQMLSRNTSDGNSSATSNSFNNNRNLVSSNITASQSNTQNTNYNFNARFNKGQSYTYGKRSSILTGVTAEYGLMVNDNANQSARQSDFRSLVSPSQNRKIARNYDNNNNGISQNLNLTLPSLLGALFKNNYALSTYSVSFKNTLRLNHRNETNRVEDLDTLSSTYRSNQYLTNKITTNQIEETPEINISKSFNKSLSNRYYKNLRFAVGAAHQFIMQKNRSEKAFQNINRNYNQFLPNASISMSNNQYGLKNDFLSLNYSKQLQIPTIDQLAPLVDSIDVYNLNLGNANLRGKGVHRFSGSFSHTNLKNLNTFNYSLSFAAEVVNNGFADSTFTDAQNRRTRYVVNVDGERSTSGSLSVNKAYKTKVGEIQLRLSSSFRFGKNPSYTNGFLNFSNIASNANQFSIFYRYKDMLALEGVSNVAINQSKQVAFNTNYKTVNYGNTLSVAYNITKKITLNSNISYNRSTSNTTNGINYTIWNASATVRFLKGNNAELKLSALDLLHQNTNMINFASANSIRTSTQTVLQQYFMTSFSYYPRIFGKSEKKK